MDRVVELIDISKRFGRVAAVDSLTLGINRGEVHALVGENGAGKTTLIKMISGAYRPDSGQIVYNGNTARWRSVHQSMQHGIGVVYQELSGALNISVAQNIYVDREPRNKAKLIDWKELKKITLDLLKTVGLQNVSPFEKARNLSVAERQLIEIAKALSFKAQLLIFDEPTASLTSKETENLFEIISRLRREKGIAVIYISHRLQEIFRIADRVSIMRDGRLVDTLEVNQATADILVRKMIGREIGKQYPDKAKETKEEVLRVENLSCKNLFRKVSFNLHKGEVLCFAGLVGAGRTELAKAIYGAIPKTGGKVYYLGKEVDIDSPKKAISMGIFYLSEDRDVEGIFPQLNILQNVISAGLGRFVKNGILSWKSIREVSNKHVQMLDIKIASLQQQISNLSGGNKQKVLCARALCIKPVVLIIDEPTKGIDVGTKAEIHQQIRNLADQGTGIIIISSELTEVIGMGDRILVMHEGNFKGIIDGHSATEELVLSKAIL